MAASGGINFSYFKLSDKIFHISALMDLGGGKKKADYDCLYMWVSWHVEFINA